MKKVSIKDIAQLAGVVPSTVSSVLNGKAKEARISEALAKKITAIADELGYQPNFTAVSLRTGKTMIIGLIVENISNPFFASLAKALEDEAFKAGYRILYGSTENNDEKGSELLKLLFYRQVEGFLIAPSTGMHETVKKLKELGKPIVLIDRYFEDLPIPSTMVDNYLGIKKCIEHLVAKGYKKIGFVTVDLDQVQMQQRELSYIEQLTSRGLYDPAFIIKVPYDLPQDEKVKTISDFLTSNRLDAVVFATNYLGIAGLESIKNSGLRIPEDLAVVCFDDNDIFRLWSPAITSLAQPIQNIAHSAIKLLLQQLNKEPIISSQLHDLQTPELVVRAST